MRTFFCAHQSQDSAKWSIVLSLQFLQLRQSKDASLESISSWYPSGKLRCRWSSICFAKFLILLLLEPRISPSQLPSGNESPSGHPFSLPLSSFTSHCKSGNKLALLIEKQARYPTERTMSPSQWSGAMLEKNPRTSGVEGGTESISRGHNNLSTNRDGLPCASISVQFSHSVMSDSATPWTAACQAPLFITNCRSLSKPMSIELVMPSNHLILCRPFLLLPSVMSLLFNMLSRLVITFLPRTKHLLISWLQTPSAVILGFHFTFL